MNPTLNTSSLPPEVPARLKRPQKRSRRLDEHAADPASEQRAEVAQVSRQEMRRPGRERGAENRLVLLLETDPSRQLPARSLGHEIPGREKPFQSRETLRCIQVAAGFLRGVARRR